jgi:hypothetical protein
MFVLLIILVCCGFLATVASACRPPVSVARGQAMQYTGSIVQAFAVDRNSKANLQRNYRLNPETHSQNWPVQNGWTYSTWLRWRFDRR